MSAKKKVILTGVALLALGCFLLPRLARQIDSTFDPIWEKAVATEAQYRDMTNAHRVASESSPGHPTRELWEQRRAALLKAGYIETREFRMRHPLAARSEVNAFFAAFHARFPGVECSVRGAKSQAVAIITARRFDFGPLGAIERFVLQYE